MSDWIERYGEALEAGLDEAESFGLDAGLRAVILDLARDVAHGTERINAPLAAFLAGRFVEARLREGLDAASALTEATDAASDLL